MGENMKRKKVCCILLLGGMVTIMASGCQSPSEVTVTKTPAAVSESAAGDSTAKTLKDAFSGDFKVGVAVNTYQLRDETLSKQITENFNSITMENEMKPENILDQRGSEESEDGSPEINTGNLDDILSLAEEKGLSVRGHCLIWHSQTPDWFFCEDYEAGNPQVDKSVMRSRMEQYIKKVMSYCQENYPGTVYAWDVVNEACDDAGGYRMNSNWYRVYGDESYIKDAFTFARKYAAEGVKLFVNDYNEYMPAKRDTIVSLLKDLRKKNLVDGIGLQSHWDMDYPDKTLLAEALSAYGSIEGLELQFTEIDMHNTDNTAEGLKKQAERYQQFFETILKADREGSANVTSVTFWGLNDGVTWLSGFKGETSYPLLFDENNEKKPCYDSLLAAAAKK